MPNTTNSQTHSDTAGLRAEMTAEFIGTFILIFIGNGAIAVAVLLGAIDLLGVVLLWALAVTLAIYAVGSISGAHINPAVTLAMAAFRGFDRRKIAPYIVAQLSGAFAASALLFLFWRGRLHVFERENELVRGEPGSQHSAMIFTTFTPNPDAFGTSSDALSQVPFWIGFLAETVASALLILAVLYLTDSINAGRPGANLAPLFIGLTVGVLVMTAGPLTMASLNPARDLGPRLIAFLAGWDSIAFPGPRWDVVIGVVGPFGGGLLGGTIYSYAIRPFYPRPHEPGRVDPLSARDVDASRRQTTTGVE